MSDLNFVVIADTHLRNVDKYGVLKDGINSRLEDNLAGIAESVEYAIKNDVDYWIHLGDVYDKINPSELLREAFFKTIAPLLGRIPIIILIGNHDTDFRNTHSLKADKYVMSLIDKKMFRVVTRPTKVKLKGVPTLILPWVEEEEMVEQLKTTSKALVLGHLELSGAQPSGSEFILREGLKPHLFNKQLFSFFGHYHKPQQGTKWMYVGSSHKLDMGEAGQSKRFLHVSVMGDDVHWTEHSIDSRPFSVWEHTEEDPIDFEAVKVNGDVIKILIEGSRDWVYAQNFNHIKNILLNKGATKVTKETKVTRASVDSTSEKIEIGNGWSGAITQFALHKQEPKMTILGKKIFHSDDWINEDN